MVKRKQKKQNDDTFRIIFLLVASFLVIFILLSGGILIPLAYKKSQEKDVPAELTPKQIAILLDIGAIKIHEDIKQNSNDKFVQLVLQRNKDLCYLYQDIFGRYYCRWNINNLN